MPETQLTPAQIAEIRERRGAISPNEPWDIMAYKPATDIHGKHSYCHIATVFGEHPNANASFIAHAPADIDALLAHIDTLTAERAILKEALECYSDCNGEGCTCGDGWSHEIALNALKQISTPQPPANK